MCEPTTIMAGASIVGTGLSIMDRVSKQGGAQSNRDAAMSVALNETIPSINQSLGQIYNSNQSRVTQERDKAATEAFDVTRQMAEAKGSVVASAGEAGVGGASFANILGDFEMREGLARGNSNYNYKTKAQQVADENEAQKNKADSQIHAVLGQAIASTPVPSSLSMWAGIGGDLVGAGLKIGDRYGMFGTKTPTKIDAATGSSYGSEYNL